MERRDVKRRNEERPSGAATAERPIKPAKSAEEKGSETNGEERFERRGREGGFARNRAPKPSEFDGGESSDGVGVRTRPIESGVFKAFVKANFEVFARRAGRRFEFEAAELVDEAHIARTVGVGAPTVVKARAHLEGRRDRTAGQAIVAERPRGERGGEKDDGGRGDDKESGENAGAEKISNPSDFKRAISPTIICRETPNILESSAPVQGWEAPESNFAIRCLLSLYFIIPFKLRGDFSGKGPKWEQNESTLRLIYNQHQYL